ncbi:MAG: DivIVA domain-containing protein, partial [Clostridia bacterium]|nr:DivIVA domain-containing protein [Clostridia bacterium]
MLTPGQIKEYKFQPAGQGVYRADEVDRFFSTVVSAYEKMYKENGDLLKRAGMLAEKVKEYQAEEELIKKTLIVAQKKADEIEETAKKKSEESVATALREAREKTAYAEKKAKELLSAAEERARQTITQADQRATDTLRGASLTAESTIGSAKGKATLLLSEAKNRAEAILSDAQKRADEILGSLKNEVIKEKKALELVRAQSKEFKEKLTQSYHEQIGMTNQLLGFVDRNDQIGEKALAAAESFEKSEEAPVVVSEDIPEVEKMMADVQALAEEKSTSYFTETPVEEEIAAVVEEPVIETVEEPQITSSEEDTSFTGGFEVNEEQSVEDEEPDFGGFSFVGGMFDDYVAEEIEEEAEEIPEVDMADIGDIFSQELSSEKAKLGFDEPEKEEKPFGRLNDKYMSLDEEETEQNSLFSKVQDEIPDDTKVYATVEEPEQEKPVAEEKAEKKPEKKKRKLSLFSMYEDDDDD